VGRVEGRAWQSESPLRAPFAAVAGGRAGWACLKASWDSPSADAYPVLMGSVSRTQARATILELLEQRDAGKSICPSEAARALGGDEGFRPLMDLVRDAADELVKAGRIEVTQHGEPVDLDRAKGPIRLRAVRLRQA
jgi:Protein of unknown function (DUF3253)